VGGVEQQVISGTAGRGTSEGRTLMGVCSDFSNYRAARLMAWSKLQPWRRSVLNFSDRRMAVFDSTKLETDQTPWTCI
jgi:hypothetical protein